MLKKRDRIEIFCMGGIGVCFVGVGMIVNILELRTIGIMLVAMSLVIRIIRIIGKIINRSSGASKEG